MSRGKRRFPSTLPDAAGGLIELLFSVQSFSFFLVGQPDDQATRHPFTVSGHKCHEAFAGSGQWYFPEVALRDVRAENGPFHLARRRRATMRTLRASETITAILPDKSNPFSALCRR